MKIHSATFVTSAADPGGYPADDLPEIAFVGRSNVGKSSLINSITNQKKLAVTSRTPGRTQLINFFDVNGHVRLVDLPGYGFAKAPRAERAKWRKMIDAYVTEREALHAVVVIIDCRHSASELDEEMLTWLAEVDVAVIPAFTKVDKLKRSARKVQIARLETAFEIPPGGGVEFSAKTGEGVRDIWACISEAIDIPLGKLGTPA